MNNLELYEKVRQVPQEAQKTIGGGRLKGMTDINPMWRIKTLTEQFGVCGVGWYYEIKKEWVESSMSSEEITANVEIALYIKVDGEWSKPIAAVGGSMLVAKEKGGLYTNDECYKMALTDAISVACKALGMGADIYWQKDNTKYNDDKKGTAPVEPTPITEFQIDELVNICDKQNKDVSKICLYFGVGELKELNSEQYLKAKKQLQK